MGDMEGIDLSEAEKWKLKTMWWEKQKRAGHEAWQMTKDFRETGEAEQKKHAEEEIQRETELNVKNDRKVKEEWRQKRKRREEEERRVKSEWSEQEGKHVVTEKEGKDER